MIRFCSPCCDKSQAVTLVAKIPSSLILSFESLLQLRQRTFYDIHSLFHIHGLPLGLTMLVCLRVRWQRNPDVATSAHVYNRSLFLVAFDSKTSKSHTRFGPYKTKIARSTIQIPEVLRQGDLLVSHGQEMVVHLLGSHYYLWEDTRPGMP